MAITPRHYLDFINHYANLFHEKRSELEEQQMHLNVGLRKIKETVDQVRQGMPVPEAVGGLSSRWVTPAWFWSLVWFRSAGGGAASGPQDQEPGAGGEERGGQRQAEKDGEGPAGG